jgi:transposase
MKKPKPLKDRLTQALLQRLRTRKITNREAAEQLNVSETYLSRTVAAMQEKEPGVTTAERAAASELAAERRAYRERLAKDVKNGVVDIATAAKRANCSERTISRYVAKYVPPVRAKKAARKRA